jgi:hypothetical protein
LPIMRIVIRSAGFQKSGPNIWISFQDFRQTLGKLDILLKYYPNQSLVLFRIDGISCVLVRHWIGPDRPRFIRNRDLGCFPASRRRRHATLNYLNILKHFLKYEIDWHFFQYKYVQLFLYHVINV